MQCDDRPGPGDCGMVSPAQSTPPAGLSRLGRLPAATWGGLWMVLLFVGVFFYTARVIDPPVIYHGFGVYTDWPVFKVGGAFLRDCLAECGGPLRYVTGFLSQWFYYRWLGALVITATAAGLYAMVRLAVRSWGSLFSHGLGLAAALALLVCANQYDPVLGTGLAIVVVAAVTLALRVSDRLGDYRVLRFAVLFAVAYYLVGAPSLIMALAAVLREAFDRRAVSAVLHATAAVAVAYFLGGYLCVFEARDIWLAGTPFHPDGRSTWTPTSLTILSTVYGGLVVVVAVAARAVPRPQATGIPPGPTTRGWTARLGRWIGWVGPPAALLIYAGILATTLSNIRWVLSIHRYQRQRDWINVLTEAVRFHRAGFYDPAANFDVDLALYHTGRLGYDLFRFPQNADALTLLAVQGLRSQIVYSRVARWCYELGDLNSAEHWAGELLEAQDDCPAYLDLLGRTHTAKGQAAAARVYFTVLSRDPVRGQTGRQLLQALQRDPDTAGEPDIARARALRRRIDKPMENSSVDQYLLDLLEDHPDNRMAFEYLMAYYLLQRQPENVVAQFHRLRPLGYTELPRLYAEAALVYSSQTRQPVNLYGYSIEADVVARFRKITTAFRAMRYDRARGMQTLAPEFGDSYFYYAMFPVEVRP